MTSIDHWSGDWECWSATFPKWPCCQLKTLLRANILISRPAKFLPLVQHEPCKFDELKFAQISISTAHALVPVPVPVLSRRSMGVTHGWTASGGVIRQSAATMRRTCRKRSHKRHGHTNFWLSQSGIRGRPSDGGSDGS